MSTVRRKYRAQTPVERGRVEREAAVYGRQRRRSTGKRTPTGPRRAPLPLRILIGGLVRLLILLWRVGCWTVSRAAGTRREHADDVQVTARRTPGGLQLRGMGARVRKARTAHEHASGGARVTPGVRTKPGRAREPARAARRRQLTPAELRQRQRQRRLLMRRLRLAAAVVLVALGLVAWIKLPRMEIFAIRQVAIEGTSAVPDLLVRRRLDHVLDGHTIFTVERAAIEREIEQLPFVREVRVNRHLPGGLSIHVAEYEPLAFGVAGDGGWLVARDGRVLVRARLADWRGRVPVVRLREGDVHAGMRMSDEPSLELLRSLPPTFPASIRAVDIGPAGLTAELHDGPRLYLGRASNLDTKLMVAERLLAIAGPGSRRTLRYVDVSVPERPAMLDG